MTFTKNENDVNYNLPILGQGKYLETKSTEFGWFYDEKCVIAFFIDKKAIFSRMVFTTGIVSKIDLTPKDEKVFLNKIIAYMKKNKLCDFIYKAQSNVVFNACPDNVECVPWGTYEVSLAGGFDDLFNSFNQKCRNAIRKAVKSNVIVKKEDDIVLVYENIKNTLLRQKSIHYPSLGYLNKLSKMNDNVVFLCSMKDNIIQGSLILLYDDYKGYAMYAGSIEKPETGSIDLLHYKAMQFLQTINIKKYDFVGTRLNIQKGSKQDGIDRFKRKFNPILKEGYAFRVIIRPIKYFLFFVLSRIYFKIKGLKYEDPILTIKSEELERISEL